VPTTSSCSLTEEGTAHSLLHWARHLPLGGARMQAWHLPGPHQATCPSCAGCCLLGWVLIFEVGQHGHAVNKARQAAA
jgi:hypothetical protein